MLFDWIPSRSRVLWLSTTARHSTTSPGAMPTWGLLYVVLRTIICNCFVAIHEAHQQWEIPWKVINWHCLCLMNVLCMSDLHIGDGGQCVCAVWSLDCMLFWLSPNQWRWRRDREKRVSRAAWHFKAASIMNLCPTWRGILGVGTSVMWGVKCVCATTFTFDFGRFKKSPHRYQLRMPPYHTENNGVTLPSKLNLLGTQRNSYLDVLFFYRSLGNSVLGYSFNLPELFQRSVAHVCSDDESGCLCLCVSVHLRLHL